MIGAIVRRSGIGLLSGLLCVSLMAAFVLFVVAGLAGGGSQGSPASVRANELNVTNAYLRAREAFLQSSRARLAAGRVPMASLVAQARASCPGSLRGTPADDVRGPTGEGSVAEQRRRIAAAEFSRGLEEGREAAQREWMGDMAALGCGRFSGANPTQVLGALSLYQTPGVRRTIREVVVSEVRL